MTENLKSYPRYLVVDGMMSGTGVRDEAEGIYLELDELGLSSSLREKMTSWLDRYRELHLSGYDDETSAAELDQIGLSIASQLSKELPGSKVNYYSDAKGSKTMID